MFNQASAPPDGTKVYRSILNLENGLEDSIVEGINILSGVLSETLGPAGRNILIDRRYRVPEFYSDGASISSEVSVSGCFIGFDYPCYDGDS